MACNGSCSIDIPNGQSVDSWELINGPAGNPYSIKFGGTPVSTNIGATWNGSGNTRGDNMDDVCFDAAPPGVYTFRATNEGVGDCGDETAIFSVVVLDGCDSTLSAHLNCGSAAELKLGDNEDLDQSPGPFGNLKSQNPHCNQVLPGSGNKRDIFFISGGSDPAYWNDTPSDGFVGDDYNFASGVLSIPSSFTDPVDPSICYGYRYRESNSSTSSDCEDCYTETVHYFKIVDPCPSSATVTGDEEICNFGQVNINTSGCGADKIAPTMNANDRDIDLRVGFAIINGCSGEVFVSSECSIPNVFYTFRSTTISLDDGDTLDYIRVNGNAVEITIDETYSGDCGTFATSVKAAIDAALGVANWEGCVVCNSGQLHIAMVNKDTGGTWYGFTGDNVQYRLNGGDGSNSPNTLYAATNNSDVFGIEGASAPSGVCPGFLDTGTTRLIINGGCELDGNRPCSDSTVILGWRVATINDFSGLDKIIVSAVYNNITLASCVDSEFNGYIGGDGSTCTCVDLEVTFTGNCDGGSPSYIWQYKPPSGAWSNIPGETSSTLLDQCNEGDYRAIVQCPGCPDVTSNTYTL